MRARDLAAQLLRLLDGEERGMLDRDMGDAERVEEGEEALRVWGMAAS